MKECNCNACGAVAPCGCEEERENRVFPLLKLILSAVLTVAALFFVQDGAIKLALFISAVVVCGYETAWKCVKNVAHGEFFDENTLMVTASAVAFALGEYFEGVIIMILYNLGEFLEDVATDGSKEKIAGLAKLKVATANLICGDEIKEVSPEDVPIGSYILVKKGERVPIDGILSDDTAETDMRDVTGESRLYVLKKGDNVFGGAINTGNAFAIKTTKVYKDSAAERIIAMVEGAAERKAKSQKFITSFAKIYTPCVVGLSLLVALVPPLFDGYDFGKWIYKALTFLIVACPCALVISVPLGFFIGIGSLAKNGVLVKGGNFIETLAETDTVVFDKTGTLTTGNFAVSEINSYSEYDEKEILNFAASLEILSSHPLARSLASVNSLQTLSAENVKEYSGKGMEGVIGGKKFLVGSESFLTENGVAVNCGEIAENTVIFVAEEERLIGRILFSDEIKPQAKELVKALGRVSVKNVAVISGDKKEIADSVGKRVGITEVYSELLPDEKVGKLSEIMKKSKGKTLYCGDGVNDSPSIAVADVGVAMGALGSEAAIDCADVVISDDNVMKIPYAIKRSKRILRTVRINIIAAISVKIVFMALGIALPLPIFAATAADVGVMLLAVLNSLCIGLKDK